MPRQRCEFCLGVLRVHRDVLLPGLREEDALQIPVCTDHVGNIVEAQLWNELVLQGIEGFFHASFSLWRGSEHDLNAQRFTGTLHVREMTYGVLKSASATGRARKINGAHWVE